MINFSKTFFLPSVFSTILFCYLYPTIARASSPSQIGVPVPGRGGASTTTADYEQYISGAYAFALKGGIGLTVLMMIYAGYKYMTSQGNPTAINEAKDIITGSLSGFSMLLLVYFLLTVLGFM